MTFAHASTRADDVFVLALLKLCIAVACSSCYDTKHAGYPLGPTATPALPMLSMHLVQPFSGLWHGDTGLAGSVGTDSHPAGTYSYLGAARAAIHGWKISASPPTARPTGRPFRPLRKAMVITESPSLSFIYFTPQSPQKPWPLLRTDECFDAQTRRARQRIFPERSPLLPPRPVTEAFGSGPRVFVHCSSNWVSLCRL